jgi:hypothetical protein
VKGGGLRVVAGPKEVPESVLLAKETALYSVMVVQVSQFHAAYTLLPDAATVGK